MLPEFGLITKADKEKLDSLPSDTLLTEIEASNTYVTKTEAENFATKVYAQRYISEALGGEGGGISGDTIDVAGETATADDGKYYFGSDGNDTIYNTADYVTINCSKGYNCIFNSGECNTYIFSGTADTICGFGDSNTLVICGNPVISTDTLSNVNIIGDGNILLRGERIAGTEGFSLDDFASIPAGTEINIKNTAKKFTTNGYIRGNSGGEEIRNDEDYIYIFPAQGNDTIINTGGHCTIHSTSGTMDYIYTDNESDTGNVYIYDVDLSQPTLHGAQICGVTGNDTIVVNNSVAAFASAINNVLQCNSGKLNLKGKRKEIYKTGNYATQYSASYYDTIPAGTVLHIKNNSDTVEEFIMYGVTGGATTNNSYNITQDYWSINTGTGNDTITNSGDHCTLYGAGGATTIKSTGDYCSINSGNGTGYIYDDGNYNIIIYQSGIDFVYGYTENDTLDITSNYSDVFIYPTVGGCYRFNFNVPFITNAYMQVKGTRIEGNTNYNEAAYNPLAAGTKIKMKTRDGFFEHTVPPIVYMSSTTISSADDNIWICGTNATNTIENSGNNVSIQCSSGNNKITNSGGNALVYAIYSSNDTIVNHGAGSTIYAYQGANSINNDAARCSIQGSGTSHESIYSSGTNSTINASVGNNYITIAADQNYNGGNQYVKSEGYCTIFANSYNTTIDTSAAALGASILCGNGNDSVYTMSDGAGGHYIDLGAGTNYCQLYDGGGNTIKGGATNTFYLRNAGSNSIIGGATSNVFQSYGDGSNTIIGGTGTDRIYFYSGADYTDGGSQCLIICGAGNDKIWNVPDYNGNYNGGNVYVFGNGEGSNTIGGFCSDSDKIYVKDNSAVTFSSNSANGFILKVGTTTVTIKGRRTEGQTSWALSGFDSISSDGESIQIEYENGNSDYLSAT